MANTLLPGDIILVNKLSYRTKLPHLPFKISMLQVLTRNNKRIWGKEEAKCWKDKHLSGFLEIKHGDVIVFHSPHNKEDELIKRCMALPGDIVQIINADVYINNNIQEDPIGSKNQYHIWYNNVNSFISITDSLGIPNTALWTSDQDLSRNIFLTYQQKKLLNDMTCIDSIVLLTKAIDYLSTKDFPSPNGYAKIINNLGPIKIPGKESRTDSIGMNFYFMLGDNRSISNDSRYWGFVSEDHIIGRASNILFSFDSNGSGVNKVRWNRIFKKIE